MMPKEVFYFSSDAITELSELWRNWKTAPVVEVGGLIFGRISIWGRVYIESIVEVPNKYRMLAKGYYDPDENVMKMMIESKLKQKLFLIGEWHSHPSGSILPSPQDVRILNKIAKVMWKYIFFIITERNLGMYLYWRGQPKAKKIM